MSNPTVGYLYERITESRRHTLSEVRNVHEPRRSVEVIELAQWSSSGVWEPLPPCLDVLDYSLWLSQVEKAKLAPRQLKVRVIQRTMIEIQNSRGVVDLVAIRQVTKDRKDGIEVVRIGRIATRLCPGVWRPLHRNGLLPLAGLKQQARTAAEAR